MLRTAADVTMGAGGFGALLLVLLFLLAILVLMVRGVRAALRLTAVGVLVVAGAAWWLGARVPSAEEPALDIEVRAAAEGGWDVTLPSLDGDPRYRITLDGQVAADSARPGVVHIDDPVLGPGEYAPGPVRVLRVAADGAGGARLTATKRFCSPVVLLAARGTDENPGKVQFGNGIGSRNWRTWMHLASQAGVAPSEPGVVPTVIGAAPVHYPATAADYATSRNAGKADLRDRLADVAKRCPSSRVVLVGYSQGADVVASVWQAEPASADQVVGVVSYADPHFDRAFVDQGIALPQGATFKHDGLLGGRGQFPDAVADRVQAWCLPKDPVCQKLPRPWGWHGDEYDVYEEWAAFYLAPTVNDVVAAAGVTTPEPVQPTRQPSTEGR